MSKKDKGWFEDPDPSLIIKGKAKARRHHDVAIKGGYKDTLREPIKPVRLEETETLHLVVDKRKIKLLEDYCADEDIELEVEGDEEDGIGVRLNAPQDKRSALLDFLGENEICVGIIEENDHEKLSDELVEKILGQQKKLAVAIDKSKTAKNVGSKRNVDDLLSWVKEPGIMDLEDVDTAED